MELKYKKIAPNNDDYIYIIANDGEDTEKERKIRLHVGFYVQLGTHINQEPELITKLSQAFSLIQKVIREGGVHDAYSNDTFLLEIIAMRGNMDDISVEFFINGISVGYDYAPILMEFRQYTSTVDGMLNKNAIKIPIDEVE